MRRKGDHLGTWATRKIYLFWVSAALASAAILAAIATDVRAGELHHVIYLTPALLFLAASAFLYRERAKTLASTRASLERTRLLIDEASDAIFVSDLESRRFVAVNRLAEALTGYTRDELLTMKVDDLAELRPEEVAGINSEIGRGRPFREEETLVTKSGARIPIEITAAAVAGGVVQAIVRPIGERKAVELSLRRSEEIFRAVSELTSDYAYSMAVHEDGTISPDWLTGAFERVTGYSVAETGGGWQNLVHPDDLADMGKLLSGALETGGTTEAEFRIIAKSGEVRHLKAWSRFEKESPDGRVVRIIGAVSDITGQKSLQEDLEATERHFRSLYERMPIGIYRRRYRGATLDANQTCVEMFGYPDLATYMAQPPEAFYDDPEDRQPWLAALEKDGTIRNYEVRYKRFDGSTFWGRNTAHMIRDSDGSLVIEGAITDISEEKELNEELKATLRDLRRADLEKKRLLTHLVRAKEEERNRVASDIHDDSVQVMTAVAIDLERLSRKMPDEQLRLTLERLETRVRDYGRWSSSSARRHSIKRESHPPCVSTSKSSVSIQASSMSCATISRRSQ
jgi:PAS domain S-box-containing protein